MAIDLARFHEEAAAEYDAAFNWYLQRSVDAALKFDAEMDRALAQIHSIAGAMGSRFAFYPQVPAETISVYCDLPVAFLLSH
jgi:hypothetical protein